MTDERRPLTMEEQASLVEGLIVRTETRAGGTAKEAWLRVDGRDVEDLQHLAKRLRRMAPHEHRIRGVVTGGRK